MAIQSIALLVNGHRRFKELIRLPLLVSYGWGALLFLVAIAYAKFIGVKNLIGFSTTEELIADRVQKETGSAHRATALLALLVWILPGIRPLIIGKLELLKKGPSRWLLSWLQNRNNATGDRFRVIIVVAGPPPDQLAADLRRYGVAPVDLRIETAVVESRPTHRFVDARHVHRTEKLWPLCWPPKLIATAIREVLKKEREDEGQRENE